MEMYIYNKMYKHKKNDQTEPDSESDENETIYQPITTVPANASLHPDMTEDKIPNIYGIDR